MAAARPAAETPSMDHDSHDDDEEPTQARLVLAAHTVPSETARILLWTMRLGITLALAGICAFGGFLLALFGLGGVALVLAAALLAITAVAWRRGMLPAAVLAAALALPAAQVVLGEIRYDRSFGTLIVRPSSPAQVAGRDFVRGFGSVLVDLRGFKAPDGSVTQIAARSDNNRVVVALPRGRCFNLDIRFQADPDGALGTRQLLTEIGRLAGLDLGSGETTMVSSTLLTSAASERETSVNSLAMEQGRVTGAPVFPLGLNLYGRVPALGSDEIRRVATGQPSAPTLRLDLRSRQQVVVRDYPNDAGPLIEPGMGGSQVADLSWPSGVTPPASPVELAYGARPSIRTAANRRRWLNWERRMVAWSTEQAKRGAGACASRKELSERGFQFNIQPESVPDGRGGGSIASGVPGAGRSRIRQMPVERRNQLLTVEVNGLGETRVLARTDDPNADTGETEDNG